jgi:hypothetical protein
MLQTVTISPAGLEVCESRDDFQPGQQCKRVARGEFSTKRDPYFAPGRASGEAEPKLVQMPLRTLQGGRDPRCKLLAGRLAVNWGDDLADLEVKTDWHEVAFPHEDFPPDIAVAEFDIDNDGQPETVLSENYHSHLTEGERYTVLPRTSWVRDVRTVDNAKDFYSALNSTVAASGDAPHGYRLSNPFAATWGDYYSLKALSVEGRILMSAIAIDTGWKAAWEDIVPPGSPARIFFEVQKGGALATVCSFGAPYRLGSQL